MSKTSKLLVTGASGQLGRRVVELLLEAGATNVVATTRSPEKLAELQKRGVDVRAADFDDAASLDKAFAGVERLLLISTDAVDRPGRRSEQHLKAVQAAVRAGVKHVVYTSLTNPDASSPISIAPDHRLTEEALQASPLSYTVLRNNMYTEMLLMSLPRAVASGQLIAAAGTGGVGYVTREDCARAAAAALLSNDTSRTTYDITGPAVVTHAELASLASEITGKPVSYVAISVKDLEGGLNAAGLPPPIVQVIASFDEGIAQGKLAVATGDVQKLTGQAPTPAAEFLKAHRAALLAPPQHH